MAAPSPRKRQPAKAKTNGARRPVSPKLIDPEQDWTLLPVEEQLRRMAWLFEELKFGVRLSFAQLALANPQVQQQLAARLVQQGRM